MKSLPDCYISADLQTAADQRFSLDLARQVATVSDKTDQLGRYTITDVHGNSFVSVIGDFHVGAYMVGHFFEFGNVWINPATIALATASGKDLVVLTNQNQVFRRRDPNWVCLHALLWKAGLTQISRVAAVNLSNVQGINPSTRGVGFNCPAAKERAQDNLIATELLPAVVAAARDAGWLALHDGRYMHPDWEVDLIHDGVPFDQLATA